MTTTMDNSGAFRLSATALRTHRVTVLRPDEAMSEADRILTQAKREAMTLTKRAAETQASAEQYLRNVADETLSDYVDHQRIEAATQSIEAVLGEAQRIRSEFDAMTPWLEELLITCLQRIAGQVGDREMLAGILREAMADLREREGLTLHVPPCDAINLAEVLAADPDRFAAVERVCEDPHLPRGCLELHGPGGVLQLGLRTQLQTLVAHLRETTP